MPTLITFLSASEKPTPTFNVFFKPLFIKNSETEMLGHKFEITRAQDLCTGTRRDG